jgi:hypothetical protein
LDELTVYAVDGFKRGPLAPNNINPDNDISGRFDKWG